MESRRRNRRPGRLAAAALSCVLIAAFSGAVRAEEPAYVSLAQLSLAELSPRTGIVTEGLYAGRIESTIALRNSEVLFVLTKKAQSGFRFSELTHESLLRMTGVVMYDGDTKTHYVLVESITKAPNARAIVVKALNAPSATAESLIEVGQWARSRRADYHDDRLEILARAAFVKALKVRDLALRADDYEGYFELAEESFELLERETLREYYVREGIDAFIFAAGTTKPKAYYDAARKAKELLPESLLVDQLLEKGFALEEGEVDTGDPEVCYMLAAKAVEVLDEGPHQRRFLTKGIDIERLALNPGDYAAYYGLARKIMEKYPEYPSYRSLVWEAILEEKSQIGETDGQAWVRLGNRVMYFLEDDYQAGLCFKEALRIDPQVADAREKLRELGHVYYRGRWWRSQELAKSEVFKRAQELEDLSVAGKVAVGMTRDQVLRAKGEPDDKSLSAGGWGVTVQWVYRDGRRLTYVDMIADTVVSKGEMGI